MFKSILAAILVITSSPLLFAQHIKIDKNALSFLNSQEKINVIFVQDSLLMIDDLYEMESIQKIKAKITRQSTVEEANTLIANYKNSKHKTWPEAFINQLNEKLSDNKNPPLFKIDNPEARY